MLFSAAVAAIIASPALSPWESEYAPIYIMARWPIFSVIERNLPFAIHNDPPVTPPDALHSMWVAVNRLASSGKVLGSEERITPENALLAYTRDAAIVIGIEDLVGTHEPGKYADFVVLSENPLEVEPVKIKDIKVEATVMNGRITHMVAEKGYYHH